MCETCLKHNCCLEDTDMVFCSSCNHFLSSNITFHVISWSEKKHAVKVKEFHDRNPKNVSDTEQKISVKVIHSVLLSSLNLIFHGYRTALIYVSLKINQIINYWWYILGHSSVGFVFIEYQRTENSKREVKEHLLNMQLHSVYLACV